MYWAGVFDIFVVLLFNIVLRWLWGIRLVLNVLGSKRRFAGGPLRHKKSSKCKILYWHYSRSSWSRVGSHIWVWKTAWWTGGWCSCTVSTSTRKPVSWGCLCAQRWSSSASCSLPFVAWQWGPDQQNLPERLLLAFAVLLKAAAYLPIALSKCGSDKIGFCGENGGDVHSVNNGYGRACVKVNPFFLYVKKVLMLRCFCETRLWIFQLTLKCCSKVSLFQVLFFCLLSFQLIFLFCVSTG